MTVEVRDAQQPVQNERPDLAELSREMVRLYKDLFGRGPTKARSDYAGPDTVICTLENSLTRAEQNMAEMGEHQRLRDVRMMFQHSSEGEFIRTVEKLTGRKVRAFVSGLDTHHDVASEVFYLAPETSTNGVQETAPG